MTVEAGVVMSYWKRIQLAGYSRTRPPELKTADPLELGDVDAVDPQADRTIPTTSAAPRPMCRT